MSSCRANVERRILGKLTIRQCSRRATVGDYCRQHDPKAKPVPREKVIAIARLIEDVIYGAGIDKDARQEIHDAIRDALGPDWMSEVDDA